MSNYTIRIVNQSSVDKSYVAFMDPPQSTPNEGATPIYTNAWATFESITDGGWDTVVYDNRPPATDSLVTADVPSVQIGEPVAFAPGIATSVARFDAQPNAVYNITPVTKFYVSDGLYVAGSIIDYSAVSSKSAAIDFTGRPHTTATVTQAADGSFTVEYS